MIYDKSHGSVYMTLISYFRDTRDTYEKQIPETLPHRPCIINNDHGM